MQVLIAARICNSSIRCPVSAALSDESGTFLFDQTAATFGRLAYDQVDGGWPERIAFNLIHIEGNPGQVQAWHVACCVQTAEPD